VAAIIDQAILRENTTLLALLGLAMVVIAIASGLIGVLQQSVSARAGQSIVFDLRNELYGHLQRMSLHFYTQTRGGEVVSRINNDVNAVAGVATGTLTSIVDNVLKLAATSAALFAISWRLALIAIAVVPAFYLPSRIVGGIRRRLSKDTQEAQASLLAFLHERLQVGGILLMSIFGQARADRAGFEKRSQRLTDLNVRQAVVGRWLFMSLSVFAVTGPALVYWYGGLQVIENELRVGVVVGFAALLGNLYRPMHQLATVYVDILASLAVFERIFEYLDLRPEVEDRADATELAAARGHVVFERVAFDYPRASENGSLPPPAPSRLSLSLSHTSKKPFGLRELSFEIMPGQRVALVGPSGAGKSTVTYLLPRFYEIKEGSVCLDGHDIRSLTLDSLRQHIGMVTQETFLFNATVLENLLYARPDATEEQVVAAARAAQIHDFISALPDGYQTLVGERGFRLSGGEKQRLSIARALLKDPEILILDEATSSLDATSEYLVQQALETLLKGRTSLIIAHRLSTILSADKILVLEHGSVIDQGTHAELLDGGGLYADLFHQQFGKVLETEAERAEALASDAPAPARAS
jgi:ATP-binding cassette subfamily B protein